MYLTRFRESSIFCSVKEEFSNIFSKVHWSVGEACFVTRKENRKERRRNVHAVKMYEGF